MENRLYEIIQSFAKYFILFKKLKHFLIRINTLYSNSDLHMENRTNIQI